MKAHDAWEHQAGWGFVGITSGLVYGIFLLIFFHFIRDTTLLANLIFKWKGIVIESMIIVLVGWLVGVVWAYLIWNQTKEKTKEIYLSRSMLISRAIFIYMFVIIDVYFRFAYPPNTYIITYIAVAILGLVLSGKIGYVIAGLLIIGMEKS